MGLTAVTAVDGASGPGWCDTSKVPLMKSSGTHPAPGGHREGDSPLMLLTVDFTEASVRRGPCPHSSPGRQAPWPHLTDEAVESVSCLRTKISPTLHATSPLLQHRVEGVTDGRPGGLVGQSLTGLAFLPGFLVHLSPLQSRSSPGRAL